MFALRNRSSVFNDSFCDLVRDETICHVSELMIIWLLYLTLSRNEINDTSDTSKINTQVTKNMSR